MPRGSTRENLSVLNCRLPLKWDGLWDGFRLAHRSSRWCKKQRECWRTRVAICSRNTCLKATSHRKLTAAPSENYLRLFAQHGLILMDPLNGGLHKVAARLYQ